MKDMTFAAKIRTVSAKNVENTLQEIFLVRILFLFQRSSLVPEAAPSLGRTWIFSLLFFFVGLSLLKPLRAALYKACVRWTVAQYVVMCVRCKFEYLWGAM